MSNNPKPNIIIEIMLIKYAWREERGEEGEGQRWLPPSPLACLPSSVYVHLLWWTSKKYNTK